MSSGQTAWLFRSRKWRNYFCCNSSILSTQGTDVSSTYLSYVSQPSWLIKEMGNGRSLCPRVLSPPLWLSVLLPMVINHKEAWLRVLLIYSITSIIYLVLRSQENIGQGEGEKVLEKIVQVKCYLDYKARSPPVQYGALLLRKKSTPSHTDKARWSAWTKSCHLRQRGWTQRTLH